jgi:hypothetical protein
MRFDRYDAACGRPIRVSQFDGAAPGGSIPPVRAASRTPATARTTSRPSGSCGTVADACGSRDRAAAERAFAGFAFAGGSLVTQVAAIAPLFREARTA